jgi:hypothetical protein
VGDGDYPGIPVLPKSFVCPRCLVCFRSSLQGEVPLRLENRCFDDLQEYLMHREPDRERWEFRAPRIVTCSARPQSILRRLTDGRSGRLLVRRDMDSRRGSEPVLGSSMTRINVSGSQTLSVTEGVEAFQINVPGPRTRWRPATSAEMLLGWRQERVVQQTKRGEAGHLDVLTHLWGGVVYSVSPRKSGRTREHKTLFGNKAHGADVTSFDASCRGVTQGDSR